MIVASRSDLRFSAQIAGGLLIIIAVCVVLRQTRLSFQIMPVIAASVIAFGADTSTAVLGASVVGFLVFLMSFFPGFLQVLKRVPANVVAGINAAIAVSILMRGAISFVELLDLEGFSIGARGGVLLAVAIIVMTVFLLYRRMRGIATLMFLIVAILSSPNLLLHLKPAFTARFALPDWESLKSFTFPYLIPEVLYSSIAITAAGIRMSAGARTQDFILARLTGSIAVLFALPASFIPAIPETPSVSFLRARECDMKPIYNCVSGVAAAGVLILFSGVLDALMEGFPRYAFPALCVLASFTYLQAVGWLSHRLDVFVALTTTVVILLTQSFGWGLVGGITVSAFLRMVLGESPGSSCVEELRDL